MSDTRRRILIAEDEPSLVVTLTDRLQAEGYDVVAVGNGEEAVQRALSDGFDLLLLDIALPRKDGFDVCRDLRQHGASLPILMLTARTQTVDKVVGLKLGADDYLTKPFDMMELLARIEALLRRAGSSLGSLEGYTFDDVRVDFRGAEVVKAGEPIDLSALEFKLLRYLIEHRGEVLSRDQLLDEVWGYQAKVQTRTVDVHVAALRQKIETNPSRPEHVVTVHGLGYKFVG